jgi:hypothetical protein
MRSSCLVRLLSIDTATHRVKNLHDFKRTVFQYATTRTRSRREAQPSQRYRLDTGFTTISRRRACPGTSLAGVLLTTTESTCSADSRSSARRDPHRCRGVTPTTPVLASPIALPRLVPSKQIARYRGVPHHFAPRRPAARIASRYPLPPSQCFYLDSVPPTAKNPKPCPLTIRRRLAA